MDLFDHNPDVRELQKWAYDRMSVEEQVAWRKNHPLRQKPPREMPTITPDWLQVDPVWWQDPTSWGMAILVLSVIAVGSYFLLR